MHSVEQGCRIGLSAHSRPAGGCRSGAGGCACKISQRKASSMHNKHMMQNVCSSIISRPHPPLKTANTENAWFVSTGQTAHTSSYRALGTAAVINSKCPYSRRSPFEGTGGGREIMLKDLVREDCASSPAALQGQWTGSRIRDLCMQHPPK